VQKGDLLFKLDTKSTNAQLSQSKAAVDNAEANLVRATDSSVVQQVTQLEATVKQAQLQYDDAKRSYDRVENLYTADAVSKQQLENAETLLKNAEVQLSSAKDNLNILNEKAAPQTAAIASAQLEQAQAAYETASIQVSDSSVTAPITGVISMRNIDEGEFVGSGIPIFTVINAKTVVIMISVPDTVVEKLHTGQQVPIKITALPDHEFTSIIDTISPAADARTQAYTVKLKLENPDSVIKPGMLAKVTLPIESKENIITVPNEAILVEDAIQYVFIVEAGKVKKIPVTTGLANDKITEVTEGLSEGASIITEGQSFLNDGEKVNIIK
jgi:multidrug resistance efflux pump